MPWLFQNIDLYQIPESDLENIHMLYFLLKQKVFIVSTESGDY